MSTETTATKPIPRLSGGVPLLGNAVEFQKDKLELLARLTRECGEIGTFTLGPKRIMAINSAELIQELLVDNSDNIHRGPFFEMFIPVMGEHSLVCIDGEYHRQQRKLQMPTLGQRRMPKYSSMMMECISQMVGALKDGEHINMDAWTGRLSRLIIAQTLFGLDEGGRAGHFEHAISMIERHLTRMASSAVPLPLWVPTPSNRATHKHILDVRRRADEIIREHEERNKGQDTGDLLSMLLSLRNEDDGSKLSAEQLRDQVVTMYIAGQETTAVAMVWMCINVAQNPEIQQKLQQEVDTQLQGRPPTYEDLPRLPYCLKTVKESLRLTPPAGAIGRETLKEIRLGDYLIPAKQFILISPWVLQRLEKYYPQPLHFDPERFTPEAEKARPRSSYLPFITGVHTCMGNHFALMEMQLLVAHLMQKVRLELTPGQNIHALPYVTTKASSSEFIIRPRAPQPQPSAAAS